MTLELRQQAALRLRCERCGSNILNWDTDSEDEPVAECVSCGRTQSYEHIAQALGLPVADFKPAAQTSRKDRHPMAEFTAHTADWRDMLRKQIAALVAEVTAVEDKKIEAEKLASALRAYGETDIPVLPWRAQRAVSSRKYGTRGKRKECTLCHRDFEYTSTRLVSGAVVCRKCIEQHSLTPDKVLRAASHA